MTSLAVALMIGIAATMTGEAPRKGRRAILSVTPPAPVPSPVPAMDGPSSERVLSLVLALEALRAAPAALDTDAS
jgi:hypothetical protein